MDCLAQETTFDLTMTFVDVTVARPSPWNGCVAEPARAFFQAYMRGCARPIPDEEAQRFFQPLLSPAAHASPDTIRTWRLVTLPARAPLFPAEFSLHGPGGPLVLSHTRDLTIVRSNYCPFLSGRAMTVRRGPALGGPGRYRFYVTCVSGPCLRLYNVPNDRFFNPSAGGVGNKQ